MHIYALHTFVKQHFFILANRLNFKLHVGMKLRVNHVRYASISHFSPNFLVSELYGPLRYSYTMVCPPVQEGIPRTSVSGVSPVLFYTHQCKPSSVWHISC